MVLCCQTNIITRWYATINWMDEMFGGSKLVHVHHISPGKCISLCVEFEWVLWKKEEKKGKQTLCSFNSTAGLCDNKSVLTLLLNVRRREHSFVFQRWNRGKSADTSHMHGEWKMLKSFTHLSSVLCCEWKLHTIRCEYVKFCYRQNVYGAQKRL